ncbi:MAG: UDP-glucose/GDP-mannose dehydrogenase family protein [bacterium]|nr:UDP-glucose/GDP-mannose dehydrogenase family protein [bacterium]
MKITVFGAGYVGLVSGIGFAEMGNEVTCVGREEAKLRQLAAGTPTIYEPGLDELLQRNLKEQRLSFTTDAANAVRWAEVIFIAVGTPSLPSGDADLSQVEAVARTIGEAVDRYTVVVDKSTVPVGTAERVERIIRDVVADRRTRGTELPAEIVDVVSNPEFLREGAAVKDFLNPDRVIVGVATPRAREVMERLYRPIVRAGRPVVWMDRRSAELAKYASNAFLATKISFVNELAQLCERVGADVSVVAKGMGMDSRIGSRFLHAGIGWGGSCFPKDVAALQRTGASVGVPITIVEAATAVNRAQRERFLDRVRISLGDLCGKTIAVWGLAFKPRTDDVREAPALTIIPALLAAGAKVRVFDSVARENAERVLGVPAGLTYATSAYDALEGADALCILTEWDEFRSPDFDRVRSLLKRPLIIDGRNIYDPSEMTALGFEYHCVGRATIPPPCHFDERSEEKSHTGAQV